MEHVSTLERIATLVDFLQLYHMRLMTRGTSDASILIGYLETANTVMKLVELAFFHSHKSWMASRMTFTEFEAVSLSFLIQDEVHDQECPQS